MTGRHSVTVTGGRHRQPAKPLPLAPAVLLAGVWASIATAVPTAGTAVAFEPGPTPPVALPAPAPTQATEPAVQRVVKAALSKIGSPYVWGAKGPDRFDCSGLTQWAYRQAGYKIAEDTYRQIKQGRAVQFPQAGDLIFTRFSSRGPEHVLLAISSTEAVEAPRRGMNVRVVPLPASATFRRIA